MSNKAYNVTVTQLTAAKKGKNANGKAKISFRGKMTVGGREVERTILAQGAAADLISGMVRKGAELALRVIFERAPANDQGGRGGEYCSVVALPRAAAA